MRASLGALLALTLGLAGCKVGPGYARPPAGTPPVYRGATEAGTDSIGDLKWAEIFKDPVLQALVTEALVNNFDVRVAVARELQARAQLSGAQANQLPNVAGSASTGYSRVPSPYNSSQTATQWQKIFGAQLQYEADLWGRLSRSTEAARANFLASDAARQAVLTTVVANVVSGYLQLLELDMELDITKRTLANRQNSLELTKIRLQGGVASLQDVRQAASLVYTASAALPVTQRLIAQTEDALSVLVGRNPGPITRGLPLLGQLNLPAVPAGVPSQLLARRPDIRQAEATLVASNAEIGVAKALYFPQITITPTASVTSTQISAIPPVPGLPSFVSTGSLGIFSIVGAASQIIFDGGRIRSQVDFATAAKQGSIAAYQGTIVEAIREVSDALYGYRYQRDLVAQQQLLASALNDSVRLANLRYSSGVVSYLEVLQAQTQAFQADIALAQAELAERSAIVQLYKALGGGWQ